MAERETYQSPGEQRKAQIIARRRRALYPPDEKPAGRLKLTPEQAGLLRAVLTAGRAQGLTFEQIATSLGGSELQGITPRQLEGYASSHGITSRKR